MLDLAEHFRRERDRKRSEWLHRRQWFTKTRREQEHRDKAEDQAADNFVSAAASVAVATEIEIRTITAKLDAYDRATVSALMDNQEKQEAVKEQLTDVATHLLQLLNLAYV